MLPLGESSLALDDEMMQALDALDPVKPLLRMDPPITTDTNGQNNTTRKRKNDSTKSLNHEESTQHRDSRPNGNTHKAHCQPEPARAAKRACKQGSEGGGSLRRSGCKDLAQKLLFSEDSEDAQLPRRGAESCQSDSAGPSRNIQPHGNIPTKQQAVDPG